MQLFAATYPEKTDALVMIGSYARRMRDADYPWGTTSDERDRFCQTIIDEWGGPVGLAERAPSMVDDEAFREWWSAYLRMGASPGAAVALTRMNAQIDIRDVLPSIRVPALVIHRTGDRLLKVEEGRYLASRIPGASFVELAGIDHLPFVGDQEALLSVIEEFLLRRDPRPASTATLATVIAIRSGGNAGDLDLLRRVFDRECAHFRGRPIAFREGLLIAAFDGPGRAVQCASSVISIAQQSRIAARAGVHIGEFDAHCSDLPLAAAAAAIADAARPFEVSASRPVTDLLAGAGFAFDDRGQVSASGSKALGVLAVRQGA